MKRIYIFWLAVVLSYFLVYSGLMIFEYTYGYNLEVRNCKLVLDAPLLNPTEDYVRCVKIIEYPFYNYFLNCFIGYLLLSILPIMFFYLPIWIYFENYNLDCNYWEGEVFSNE